VGYSLHAGHCQWLNDPLKAKISYLGYYAGDRGLLRFEGKADQGKRAEWQA